MEEQEQQASVEVVATKPTRFRRKTIIIAGSVLLVILGGYMFWTDRFPVDSAERTIQSLTGNVTEEGKNLPQSNIVSDPDGKLFVSNQVIVGFKAGVPLEEVVELFASIKAKDLQHFTDTPLFLLEVPDKGEGKEAIKIVAKLKEDTRVEYVGLNYLTEAGAKDETVPAR